MRGVRQDVAVCANRCAGYSLSCAGRGYRGGKAPRGFLIRGLAGRFARFRPLSWRRNLRSILRVVRRNSSSADQPHAWAWATSLNKAGPIADLVAFLVL